MSKVSWISAMLVDFSLTNLYSSLFSSLFHIPIRWSTDTEYRFDPKKNVKEISIKNYFARFCICSGIQKKTSFNMLESNGLSFLSLVCCISSQTSSPSSLLENICFHLKSELR